MRELENLPAKSRVGRLRKPKGKSLRTILPSVSKIGRAQLTVRAWEGADPRIGRAVAMLSEVCVKTGSTHAKSIIAALDHLDEHAVGQAQR